MAAERLTLILLHRGPEYARDFREIAEKVTALDPAIDVYIGSVKDQLRLPPQAWQQRTLVVSLNSMFMTKVRRGTVLRSRQIAKLAQLDIARKAGIAVPPAIPFAPGMKLDPILFGEYVVIKPMSFGFTSRATGVQLFRRRTLEGMRSSDFPADHPIHADKQGYIVQRYVDTSPYPAYNRVLTYVGEPIYAAHGRLDTERPPLDAPDAVLSAGNIAIQGPGRRIRQWGVDDDVMTMARAVAAAFADVPLLAIDALREEKTGRLYFLEANPGGNTWHFSSMQPGHVKMRLLIGGDVEKTGEQAAMELGRRRMIDASGAFDAAARALVERTRTAAS